MSTLPRILDYPDAQRGREVEDERNDLVFEFLRFVEGLMPKVVMMENVHGLVKDDRFKVFCEKLEEF